MLNRIFQQNRSKQCSERHAMPQNACKYGEIWKWRERVGIEPTSRLATASAILKTVRTTRFVRSHVP